MSESSRYDVLVVGAGPAGSIAATKLARQGLSVALLEPSAQQHQCDATARVDTLPPQANALLDQLDMRPALAACDARACHGVVSVWFGTEPIEHDYLMSPFGIGWHVNRSRFDASLRKTASAHPNVNLYVAEFESSSAVAGCFQSRARRANGERYSFTSRYIVDASGRNAAVAMQLGAEPTQQERYFAARTLLESPATIADERLWLERTAHGWFYTVPFDAHHIQLSFVGDRNFFRVNWQQRLMRECASLQAIKLPSQPTATWRSCKAGQRLTMARCDKDRCQTVATQFVAVGDAAMTISPLAGQGLLLAMQSAIEGAAAILAHRQGQVTATSKYHAGVQNRFAAAQKTIRELLRKAPQTKVHRTTSM